MKCEQVQERLSEYLENLLDEEVYRAVQSHLSSCPGCQAEAGTLTQARRLVANLPPVEPPPGFSRKVMARIREEAQRPSLWHRLFLPIRIKVPIHAMAILLAGGLAVYLYQVNVPRQVESAKPAPSELELPHQIEPHSKPPAAPPPDKTASAAPDRTKDRLQKIESAIEKDKMPLMSTAPDVGKEPERKAFARSLAEEVPMAPPQMALPPQSVGTADYLLILAPKDPQEGRKTLTRKLEGVVKNTGGQFVRPEEETSKSQSLMPSHTQRFTLMIPRDRFAQFKLELESFGKILSEAPPATAPPEISVRAFSGDQPSEEGIPPLRIRLILQLPEKP